MFCYITLSDSLCLFCLFEENALWRIISIGHLVGILIGLYMLMMKSTDFYLLKLSGV